jgi:hypothetical protein
LANASVTVGMETGLLKLILAVPFARSTDALAIPDIPINVFSTCPTQDAQDIPSICNVIDFIFLPIKIHTFESVSNPSSGWRVKSFVKH